MGNTQKSGQGYQPVNGRQEVQQNGNNQNRNQVLRKIQQMYPQINEKELTIFANSNRDIIFWSVQDPNFEQKAQKTLEKHFSSQETKYTQLIERLYAHRQAQMKQGINNNVSNLLDQSDQLNEQDMKIIFENASLLEKIDKMRDFFLIKHNNPLQLSLQITILVNTFKQIIDNGDNDEDLYINIVKGYTMFYGNLSKLLQLCGFEEFNEDGQTIGLYYAQKNLSLIKTLYRYIKQKYHQQIKPLEPLIKEISEQNSFKFQSSNYSYDHYQQQSFNNSKLSSDQIEKRKQQLKNNTKDNQIQENKSGYDENKNNFNEIKQKQFEQSKQKLQEQYKSKNQASSPIEVTPNPIYQQISTVIQGKAVQERVKAQIEARQRREEQNKKKQRDQFDQPKNNKEDQLFDEREFISQSSQEGVGVTQFELQDFSPKETQEMRLGRAIIEQINKFRSQNNLQPLTYNANIYPTCEFHSRNMSNGEVEFGHDGFDQRVRELSLFTNFVLVCESVVKSTTPVDCLKSVQELINNERHKKNLLSPSTHICVGVYRQNPYSNDNIIHLTSHHFLNKVNRELLF